MDLFEQRIKELREIINRHNHNYYVLNAPTVSDQEFDALLRELQELERDYPQYQDPLSPTQRVGSASAATSARASPRYATSAP